MDKKQNPNMDILLLAVEKLGALTDEMVFLGGCATGLLITDSAARSVRVTRDVDVIVQVLNHGEYYRLCERLRLQGFQEDTSDEAPLCRWRADSLILDVLPTQTEILGFGNDWYIPAMEHAELFELAKGVDIRRVSAPYFLITKLEAFAGRGNNDYLLSHDIEDIISVIDGRLELLDEIQNSETDLKQALAKRFARLLKENSFTDAIPGHLLPDEASQARVPIVLERIRSIVTID